MTDMRKGSIASVGSGVESRWEVETRIRPGSVSRHDRMISQKSKRDQFGTELEPDSNEVWARKLAFNDAYVFRDAREALDLSRTERYAVPTADITTHSDEVDTYVALASTADLSTLKPFILPWLRWQGSRGVYESMLSYYLIATAVVIGFGTFNSYWQTLLASGSKPDFIILALQSVLMGLPLLQLEIAFGSVYRGGGIKTMFCLNRRLTGFGVLMLYSLASIALLIGNTNTECLLYAYYSVEEHPRYLLTEKDRDFCSSMIDKKDCEDASYGLLCVYGEKCVASQIGKAALVYRKLNNPTKYDPSVDPTAFDTLRCGLIVLNWVLAFIYLLPGVEGYSYFSGVTMFLAFVLTGRSVYNAITKTSDTQAAQQSFALPESQQPPSSPWNYSDTFYIVQTFDDTVSQLQSSVNGILGQGSWNASITFVMYSFSLGVSAHSTIASKTKICSSSLPQSYPILFTDLALGLLGLAAPIMAVKAQAEINKIPTEVLLERVTDVPPVFSIYPATFGPNTTQQKLFGIFFYLSIFIISLQTLAITIDVLIVSLQDIWGLRYIRRLYLSIFLCVTGLLTSLPSAYKTPEFNISRIAGYSVDFFIPVTALVQVFHFAYVKNHEHQANRVGYSALGLFNIGILAPVIVGSILTRFDVTAPYALFSLTAIPVIALTGCIVAHQLQNISFWEAFKALCLGNMIVTARELNRVMSGKQSMIREFNLILCFVLKFCCVPTLVVCVTHASVKVADQLWPLYLVLPLPIITAIFPCLLKPLVPRSDQIVRIRDLPSRIIETRVSWREWMKLAASEFMFSGPSKHLGSVDHRTDLYLGLASIMRSQTSTVLKPSTSKAASEDEPLSVPIASHTSSVLSETVGEIKLRNELKTKITRINAHRRSKRSGDDNTFAL